jgi:hypothetical protein
VGELRPTPYLGTAIHSGDRLAAYRSGQGWLFTAMFLAFLPAVAGFGELEHWCGLLSRKIKKPSDGYIPSLSLLVSDTAYRDATGSNKNLS